MEIPDIKQQLTLSQVLQYYGLKPDKHARLHCPFHDDSTPSMLVYYKTHTAYCFSSNCKTHSKAMDVIDFVMYKENCTKHEAIEKCKQLISGGATHPPVERLTRVAVLTKMFMYFKNGVHNSKPAQEYLRSRALDATRIEVGYNTAQFHHGARREDALIRSCVEVGLLSPWGTNVRSGSSAYKVFAKQCIVFALRNRQHQVCGLYFRSTINNEDQRHFYLRDRQGLYPRYPKAETTKLILTESVIDAATLLQVEEIVSGYSVLALYGTNGFTTEHREAVTALPQLAEIICWLNADEAGREATDKYAKLFCELLPSVKLTQVVMPEGEDVNSLAQGHEDRNIFIHLLQERKEIFLSNEKATNARDTKLFIDTTNDSEELAEKPAVNVGATGEPSGGTGSPALLPATTVTAQLDTTNADQFHYHTDGMLITLLGGISLSHVDRLRVTLYLRRNPHINPSYSVRQTIDLYQGELVEKFIRRVAEKLELPTPVIAEAIAGLTEAAEQWRLEKLERQKTVKPERKELTLQEVERATSNLRRADLMEWTRECYSKTGIIGELVNAMILHVAMTSRRSADPVSVICLSASGMGKSYLMERVALCFPGEEIIENTQMTENSFYYFQREAIKGKIFLIEDMDGAMNVEYPLRELISKKRISKTVTLKDSKGNLKTVTLTVEGPVTFCGCTTREKLYEDNANRCLLIHLDSSSQQDVQVMDYHKQVRAGLINKHEEDEVRTALRQMQQIIRPMPVINPYAPLIDLPVEVFKPRRTLSLLLSFIESITLYHQYQCERESGQLITHPSHIAWAFKLLRDVLFRKSDELSAAQRSFLERLRALLKSTGRISFYSSDIRKELRLSPRTLRRYLYELQEYGYLKITGGNKYRKGYEYALVEAEGDLRSSIDQHIASVMERVDAAYQQQSRAVSGPELAKSGVAN